MLLGTSDDDGSRCDCQPFHHKRIHKKDEDGLEKRGVTVSFQVIFLVALVVVVLLVQDLTNMSSFLPVFTRLLLLFVVVLHKNKKVRSTCRFCGSNQSNCRLILLHMHLILPTICLCLSLSLFVSFVATRSRTFFVLWKESLSRQQQQEKTKKIPSKHD